MEVEEKFSNNDINMKIENNYEDIKGFKLE